ncbi:hypothetical protein GCM10007977_059630 [Dactylosporangium sucinum]|uniref:Uncharacterized protein n=1 Tax=Dactylosporangium sucinum TaxID=1424081 RepID=A0A917U2C6_9ACTN|nr:hypothetical protein GCM10007977_059630 [Dactylosporangium sucinum]
MTLPLVTSVPISVLTGTLALPVPGVTVNPTGGVVTFVAVGFFELSHADSPNCAPIASTISVAAPRRSRVMFCA